MTRCNMTATKACKNYKSAFIHNNGSRCMPIIRRKSKFMINMVDRFTYTLRAEARVNRVMLTLIIMINPNKPNITRVLIPVTNLFKINNIPLPIKQLLIHSTTSLVQLNSKTVNLMIINTNNMSSLQRHLKQATAIRNTTLKANSIPQVIGA